MRVLSETNASKTTDIDKVALKKLTKDPLVDIVISLVSVLEENVRICRSAAEKIDDLKSEQIELQRKLISNTRATRWRL